MGKKSKPKPVRVKDPQKGAAVRRAVMHTLAVIVFVGLLVGGTRWIKQYVDHFLVANDRPPRVVIMNRPAWMSDALAAQLVRSIQPTKPYSPFDKQLLVETVEILGHNPWIRKIYSVRRAYNKQPGDTLEVDCDYRAPIALVHWEKYYWLIDTEGVKLPQEFTEQQLPSIIKGDDGRLNIRIIEGVSEAPVESGRKWSGEDLSAAIDMVKLLYGKSYAEEIVRVDVSNFGGRIDRRESQITLTTRYDTSIRWGRPINAKDFFIEVPTAQKLERLEQIWAQYRRVDAGRPWVDIRMDAVTYPSSEPDSQTNAAR